MNDGFVGQGQQLVVMSTAELPGNEASVVDIEYFLQNVSDAQARRSSERTLPNPQNDFDQLPGGGTEFELDAEMQSMGSPGADSITLEISPASEIFSTGVNDIVNNLPGDDRGQHLARHLRAAVDAAEPCELGDHGASERRHPGRHRGADLVGGDRRHRRRRLPGRRDGLGRLPRRRSRRWWRPAAPRSRTRAGTRTTRITAYQQEVVWNDGSRQGGAAGGGSSQVFPTPAYQAGLGVTSRSLPDISLIAGLPGVATDSTVPGQLFTVEGTSVAAPLSAGFFALIASRAGCRLGDVHPALYALGSRAAGRRRRASSTTSRSGNRLRRRRHRSLGRTGLRLGLGLGLVGRLCARQRVARLPGAGCRTGGCGAGCG